MKDKFATLKDEQQGLYREKGSKFIAYAFPIENLESFESRMLEIRKEHPKARHFCYAYQLGINDDSFRYNDDGEPSGSAGVPIFNQLKSFELHKSAVIVVRYFGGKKLGVPGLINAYKQSTHEALDTAERIVRYIEDTIKIGYQFDQTGPVMRALNEMNVNIIENGYTQNPYIVCRLRRSLTRSLKLQVLARLLGRDLADIQGDEKVEGYYFEIS